MEEGIFSKGIADFKNRIGLLKFGERISTVKQYTSADIDMAISRAMVILCDRLATRGRETISEQARESVANTLRNLAQSLHVRGPVSPIVEDLTDFLLGAFDYLPVEGWTANVQNPPEQS